MTRVLVIDDEPQILRALRINLRARQYEVDTALTGGQALHQAAQHPPDLVILDLGLPDMDGVDVIAGLRGWTDAPIIVLSGRADSTDKVEALDSGADDYVTRRTRSRLMTGTSRICTSTFRQTTRGNPFQSGRKTSKMHISTEVRASMKLARDTKRTGSCLLTFQDWYFACHLRQLIREILPDADRLASTDQREDSG